LAKIAYQCSGLVIISGITIAIDASRNRSGGARAHLIGILTAGEPFKHGIREVHLWAFRSILNSIPDRNWLVKHNPKELEQSLPMQLWWQATRLSREITANGCDILFSTDASTLCHFRPMVVLSQDMLSYEPGVMRYFGYTKARLRLLGILYLQNRAFRLANGVIFLTKYAAKVIQQSCGLLPQIAFIPHGVGDDFKLIQMTRGWPSEGEQSFRCLYVSNTEMYKHQWVVVRAIAELRRRGHNITLTLVGGGSGQAKMMLDEQCAASDPDGLFVVKTDFISQKELPMQLASADLFVFASSCENMPVTLVEAMAVGLPIACSNRGPMPEVLVDGGVYFDPEDADSITDAIEQIIKNPVLRVRIAQRSKTIAEQYSWSRCADETWAFIVKTYNNIKI
jgi:glycosyltransferase involved in cell wall biosynthesis